jgi:DNA-binding SARP family transcriptional activator
MPTLKLQLFGRFCVSYDGRELYSFDAGKVRELLCYLSLYRKPHAREMLAGLLWSESSTSQAKKYLRQALWQLQATLETNLGPLKQRLALVEADWVRLNPALDLWLDVVEFEKACVSASAGNHELDPDKAKSLHEAVQLYQGDLLEGCYQDWCLYERERLQNIYLATLDRLICYSEANQFYQEALTYATEVLRYDPARERAHRQIMRLYFAFGDRTASLRQYQRCVAALKTELGVCPSARTRTLFERIQADEIDPSPLPASEKLTPENATTLLPEVLDHLKTVRSTLSNIQRQVQKDIRTVELALIGRR